VGLLYDSLHNATVIIEKEVKQIEVGWIRVVKQNVRPQLISAFLCFKALNSTLRIGSDTSVAYPEVLAKMPCHIVVPTM
jgi:hypothetical protein